MSDEYTWQQRWARGGARLTDDWRQYYRANISGYSKLDDEYEGLQAFFAKKKISAHELAIKGGKLFVQMDELTKHVPLPKDSDGIVRGPPS